MITKSAHKLVVFEGIDGSGKSEQLVRLKAWLSECGMQVAVPASEPSRIRRFYRELISREEEFPSALTSTLISLGDYADLVSAWERSAAGGVTVLHRYIYSAVSDAVALGLQLGPLLEVAATFPKPSVTIWIDTPEALALARKRTISLAEAGGPEFLRGHRDRAKGFLDYQSRVRTAYESIFKSLPCGTLVRVDGSGDADSVHRKVRHELGGFIPWLEAAS